ncbi:hypothetical protein C8R46DRAFT_1124164 [Mycena filopes]|nr:hypothetical protein C8R46DRAFT_1124164 [Mycena filopes]
MIAAVVEAGIHFHRGDYIEAEHGFRRLVANTEWVDLAMMAMERLGTLALKTGDMCTAMECSVLLLVSACKTDDLAAKHQALRRLGDIFLLDGDDEVALILFQVALEGFRIMGIHRAIADCLLRIGDVWHSRGDLVQAKEMWTEARPLFEKSSQGADILQCDQRLAQL